MTATQQADSLVAVSQPIGFRLTAAELHVLPREPRRARKFRAAQYESDRRADLVRWASGKINALLITATLVSLWNFASFGASEATLSCARAKHSSNFGQSNYIILRDSRKATISAPFSEIRMAD